MNPLEDIFPEGGEDAQQPFLRIAEHLRCPIEVVWRGFYGLDVPAWSTPMHLDAVKATAHHLNEMARQAQNLLDAMEGLSPKEREMLTQAGCVTVYQIEHLMAVLNGDAEGLFLITEGHDRRGGRNPAAYIVAEGMRRIFRRLRRTITFGQTYDGYPSTEFGRAVQFALGEFGIRANWRGPARNARERQDQIQARMTRCAITKAREKRTNTN